MKKNYICISCPMGCHLELEDTNKKIIVTGYKCPRGEEYAKEEYLTPKRTITSTCKINSIKYNRLPVKTDKPILKEHIINLLSEIYNLDINPPIKSGDIIISNYNNTDVNVVSSKTILF